MRSSDFFIEDNVSHFGGIGPSGSTVARLDHQLLDQLRLGPLPNASDESAAEGLLDLVEDELQEFGTAGNQQLSEPESVQVIRTLDAVTKRLGIPLDLPFRSFSTFRSYWIREGASGHGGWQARRDLLAEFFGPAREALDDLISGGGRPQIEEQLIAELRDPAAIRDHLDRLQRSANNDPALAIGTAKELVESTAKTVLVELDLQINEKDDLPALVSQAQMALGLHPSSQAPGPDGIDAVRRILGGLMTVTTGLGELRNRGYGTGHGPAGQRIGLHQRHARLAVSASVTWCSFVLDTLTDPVAPWRKNVT